MSNTNIQIARRFNSLLEAVTELNVDLSFNREYALGEINQISNYRDLSLGAVFADETNQIWYIIKSLREGLNLVHKYKPFHSCLSDSPFKGYVPVKDGEVCDLDESDTLKQIGEFPKTSEARRLLAKVGIIAG